MRELREVLGSRGFQMTVIYGRRRVGKTELVLNATKNRKRVYYLATAGNNLARFHEACAAFDGKAAKLRADWEVLFGFLRGRAEAVIIDEFQNLISEDAGILSLFQSIVDVTLRGSGMKLFLLGSSVSMMTSRVLSYKSPLYGRRTGSMNLKPVSFFELAEFFPRAGTEELMDIYGFADGIPYYLIRIDRGFWPWLKGELGRRRTFLRDEVDFLIRYEFSDVGTYRLLLEAIAKGKTKLNEIKEFMGASRTDIAPYLSNLIGVGLISRELPVTESTKSRKGRYRISDNFLRFWFRYIYPSLSSIEEGAFDVSAIRADYSAYLGRVFEDVCRQFIARKMPAHFTKIGRWWEGDKEIDIVGLNDKTGEALFVECKWKDNVNAAAVLADLKEKAVHVAWRNGRRKEKYCIIAKSFSKRADGCVLFDLDDMRKYMRR
ncbi:MAG: ATP-binding protein [Candidatus Aenigmarchaeota archaeon]|nr:ATP-binding protein [Candidatus Aenigmarchaeota archaeon]